MQDADAWQALDRDDQDDLLSAGVADLQGTRGSGSWRHLTDSEQEATIAAIEDRELSATERAMADALSETWTAELWAHDDSIPTVPFECRELSAEEQAVVQDMAGLITRLEGQLADLAEADADDIPDLDTESQYFESAADLNEFIEWLLADVTVDDAFDEERFRTGRGLRPNTQSLLLAEIVFRYEEEQANALKFRAEQ
jgi:hypothetical protein